MCIYPNNLQQIFKIALTTQWVYIVPTLTSVRTLAGPLLQSSMSIWSLEIYPSRTVAITLDVAGFFLIENKR